LYPRGVITGKRRQACRTVPSNERDLEMPAADDVTVVRNDSGERYEVYRDRLMAELTYSLEGEVMYLLHTEVPTELEGHGIGGALVRAAMEDARAQGLRVIAFCPFARTWLARHPEYAGLISGD
jgi:predicted GNAT family acetyltransferase